MQQDVSQDRSQARPGERTVREVSDPRRRFSVEWGGLTHKGLVRANNEDCFFLGRFDRMLQPVLTNLPDSVEQCWHYDAGFGVIVADGMGGEAAGEVASHTAVSTLIDLAVATPDWIMRYDDPSLVDEVIRRTEARIRQVDDLLQAIGRSQPRLAGLGTTITILALLPPHGLIVHVGDSRAYLMREGQLRQLTRDHTMAQQLADAGLIDPRDVPRHPTRNVLTSAAGHGGGLLTVDAHRLRVNSGDQILLCTDGLTGMLGDEDIAGVLAGPESAAGACQTLVDRALERGGRDNVTVVLGRLTEERTR
jgi:PPM family protein phosphatase